MANLYNNYSSSSSPQEPDEISLFLQQILLRSSSSSSSSFTRPSDHFVAENQEPAMVPGPGQISGLNSSSGCSFTARTVDNEPDEYDYESEEAVEALVGETARKPTQPRSSSKRSRAAEVHNLSEKRRRSRINEKMKALQNLIPNANKTDKASMLDEAIEYLKQLQLQVQMLTMRNGLNLYPICLPGMLQPNETSQAPLADFSTVIGSSKTSFAIDSSPQDHFVPLQFSRSSKAICPEKVLPCPPLNKGCPHTSSTGAKATSSIPFETQPSDLKENTLEACLVAGGDHLQPNFVNNSIFSSQLNM